MRNAVSEGKVISIITREVFYKLGIIQEATDQMGSRKYCGLRN